MKTIQIIYNDEWGHKEYHYWKSPLNGVRYAHREDGPAVTMQDNREIWFLNGHPIFSKEEFDKIVDKSTYGYQHLPIEDRL